MGAHESMEHAEHAEHASGSNKKIALLIAVIALFLALSETLGKGAQTEAISKNVEASNLWAFFQAKSIRRTVVQATAEHAKLSLGADRRRRRQGGAAKADRRLEQDRGALSLGAGNRRGFGSNSPSAPSRPSTSATMRRRNITITKSPPPPSRSASCWRRRPSSPACSCWPGSRAGWRLAGIAITGLGLYVPHLLHLH